MRRQPSIFSFGAILFMPFNNFSGCAPETAFFAKLPMSDVEGNPALCLSLCPGDASDRARRAARVATAVLVSALVVLLIAAADRKRTRLNSSHSGESRMPSSA